MVQLTLASVNNVNLFSDHYLEERLEKTAEWKEEDGIREAYAQINKVYGREKDLLESYNEAQLEKNFVMPVLEVLGHNFAIQERVQISAMRPDYAFFENENDKRDAFKHKDSDDFYKKAIAVGDAKVWGKNLDKKSRGRDIFENHNPSYQIDYYLRTTKPNWGILTNGRKWRLYYDKCPQPIGTYYEVDLVDVLEKDDFEDFKYFYLFFRREAFTPVGGSFLDKIYNQSLKYAQEIGENLEDNVYKALLWMAKGFFKVKQNQLEIDAENVKKVHDNSLIFLYRLLFLLYAESKGLLASEEKIPRKYSEYSVNRLVDELLGKKDNNTLNERGGIYYFRLNSIFRLVREGSEGYDIPREEFYVPAYNGGLFDSEKHPFLRDNTLQDGYLSNIVDLLARTESEDGTGKRRVDYSDLSLRHLGGIYEGLLEYKLKIADQDMVALKKKGTLKWIPLSESKNDFSEFDEDKRVRKGEIYLETDRGERKATGSYYTPDYIVKYIVENTVGPVLEEKLEGAETNGEKRKAILSTKVLDPAMGSGHFLVNAMDFIANELVKYVEEGEVEERDIDWAKRKVARNCLYGVDVNLLATELAKVSLWLNTIAEDKPLSFLDHHLKTGNSLIGADIHKLDKHPEDEGKVTERGEKAGQLALSDFFGKSVRDDIKQLLSVYSQMLEVTEERPEDIKEQEDLFQKFEDHSFKKKFDVLADVQTGYYFGNEFSKMQYENLLNAFRGNEDEWKEITNEEWVKKASDSVPGKIEDNLSDKKRFFHWKLEFPEVFFNIREGKGRDNPGFDAVVGNPPYNAEYSKSDKEFVKQKFLHSKGNYNSANQFIELAHNLSKNRHGMIIPKSICYSNKWSRARQFLLPYLEFLMDASKAFEEVLLEQVVYISESGNGLEEVETGKFSLDQKIINRTVIEKSVFKKLDTWITSASEREEQIAVKILDMGKFFSEVSSITRGELLQDITNTEGEVPVYRCNSVERFHLKEAEDFISKHDYKEKEDELEYLEKRKLMVQNIIAHVTKPTDRIITMGVVDENKSIDLDNVGNVFLKENAKGHTLHSLCAIFQSSLLCWYLYRFVYGSAIRTMRYDGVHLSKTPLEYSEKVAKNLTELSKKIHDLKNRKTKEAKSFLKWFSREWKVDIGDLSRKTYLKEYWEYGFDEDRKSILNIAKHNSSKVSGDPSSRKFQEKLEKEWRASVDRLKPLMEEIQDLENQIDALVFELYELDKEEVKTVLDSLETENEIKEDILAKFENINE